MSQTLALNHVARLYLH